HNFTLLSLPTRRSSDLVVRYCSWNCVLSHIENTHLQFKNRPTGSKALISRISLSASRCKRLSYFFRFFLLLFRSCNFETHPRFRSEEHTSELQSRSDLV